MMTAILSSAASRATEPAEPDWHNAANSANAAVPRVRAISAARLRGMGEHRSSHPAPGRITSPQRQPAADMRRETARRCSRTLRPFGTCWSPENQEKQGERIVRRQPPWLAEASRCAPGAPARPALQPVTSCRQQPGENAPPTSP